MNIRHFIFTMGFLLLITSKTATASSNNVGMISQECKESNTSCDVIYISTNKQRTVLLEDYPIESTVKYHSTHLAEIQSSCGSPCSASIFVDLNNDKIDNINMPIAFSKEYLIIAYTDENSLIIKSLFSDKKVALNVDFSPVAVLNNAIEKFEFISKNTIKLTYLSTSDFVTKTKVFSVDL